MPGDAVVPGFRSPATIDDSQGVLRAIRTTPPGRAIVMILHTPGGLVLAASQIAQALRDHVGKVTAVLPHFDERRNADRARSAARPVRGRIARRDGGDARRP